MENNITLEKLSRNEMYKGEDIYSFIKENLHTTQEIVKFYSGNWGDYLYLNAVPRELYGDLLKSLIKAWENKEDYLKKVLTPANINKIIIGNRPDIYDSLSLSSPGFISSNKDAINGVSGCLACELESFDFSKINHKDVFDSRFYDLLVGVTAMQLIKQKNNANLQTLNLDSRFAADIFKEMDKIIKADFSKVSTSENQKITMLFFFDNYINLINVSDRSEDYYKYLDKAFLSQQAYSDGWTGNYTHLILATSLDIVVRDEKGNALESFKNKFDYLKKNCLHAGVAVKNDRGDDLEIYLKDLLIGRILPFTTSSATEEDHKKLETIVSALNKEFSYLKSNPSSIEKLFISMESYYLENNHFFVEDKINDLIDFFDFETVKKIANKRGYAPPLVSKRIVKDVLDISDSHSDGKTADFLGFKI